MTRIEAPPAIDELVANMAALPGVVAISLGGSRATGGARDDSDWDLGVYYRAGDHPLNPNDVCALGYHGEVSELGAWGPIVNGGAWLTLDGSAVDLLFRDLDLVER